LWYSALLRYPLFVTHITKDTYNDKVYEYKSSHVSVAALEYVAPSAVAPAVDNIASAEKFAYDVYPNPIKSDALVSYTLQEPAKVAVKVYDVYGQLQQVLISEAQQTGSYQYTYTPATVGTYFVVLEVNGERVSKQVVKQNN